jgi:hypothetical protein
MECYKRGGRRKKVKVSQKAAQNVTVNVKNVMRNDRTMIYPDMYKKQMDQSQNVGRQNLFSGPPLQYASPPQVIYMPHPNVGKQAILDTVNTGNNPNPNQRRIAIEDNNIAQPYLIPVNPNDITQRTPSQRMVPSTQTMPSLQITQSTPRLPVNPIQEGPIPHMHSAGEDMKAELVSFRIEPSQPSMAGLSSQLIGGVEQQAVEIPHEVTPAQKRRGRPPKEAGAPKSPYVRRARSPERSPSVVAEPSSSVF